jgi:hypothetical protein
MDEYEMRFADRFIIDLNGQVDASAQVAQGMGLPVEYVAETEGVMQPNHTVCHGDEAYARSAASI